MAITLYELTGADDECRFSPYCWRIRMALAHKGLDADTRTWRFVEKDAIAASGQGRVPVIIDGDRVVHDSWTIANYLDETYPDRPLFTDGAGRAMTLLLKTWMEKTLHPLISRMILVDIHEVLHQKDIAYFRETREKMFGKALEAVVADREETLAVFRRTLEPLRAALAESPFLGGAAPAFADYVAFGTFQWARVTSAYPLLDPADTVAAWRERMLDLFGGLARATPARGHFTAETA